MKYYFLALGKYAKSDGRATRREFIWFCVFHYLFVFIFAFLDSSLGLYDLDLRHARKPRRALSRDKGA